MKEEAIVNGRQLFTSNANVNKLLNHIEDYKNKKLVIMFKKNNVVYDEMIIENINFQHVYYDIFTKELTFGNGVKVDLRNITRIDKYSAGTETRFSIHYEVNRETYSVALQNIV